MKRRRQHRPSDLGQRLGSLSLIRNARTKAKNEKGTKRTTRVKTTKRKPISSRRDTEQAEIPGPWRIRIVLAVLAIGGLVVLGRAYQLQLMQGDRYGEVAEKQATSLSRINAKRGFIKDRHGSELAITVDVDSVFAEPRRVADPTTSARKVAKIIGVAQKAVKKKLASKRTFTYLRRRVDSAVAERIRQLDIRGVSTHTEPKRFYSNIGLAAHVLGFTNLDGQGQAGIERRFEQVLRGKSYDVPGLRDALGKRVLSEGFVPHAVLEGADVHLTIDRQIQHAAEEALQQAVLKNRGTAGVAIVLEVGTSEVLALASYPSFNPNNLQGTTPHEHLNRAVSAVYEPGSTMKMVTIAGALEDGLVRASDKIDCEGGRWRVGGRTIGDSNHAYNELTISEIMKKSSNICAAKIGIALGRDRLYYWLNRHGFGVRTGIELPGELKGLIRPASSWREIELANIAFGQGIAVTPLQIATAAAAVANKGVMVHPRIVRQIVEKNGSARRLDRPRPIRVYSEKTATLVTQMMVEVTQKGGTAPEAQIPGFFVAGKTGTSQKIDPVTRAYSHELYVASFAGFVPADRPEVAILVLVDEPKASIYGGSVAAPAFAKIAMASLSARGVFPEDQSKKEAFLASYRESNRAVSLPKRSKKTNNIKRISKPSSKPVDRLSSGLSAEAQKLLGIVRLEAPKGAAVKNRRGDQPVMPNFAGLEVHEVLDRSAAVGCDPVLVGTGRVISQAPPAGTRVPFGTRCELVFSQRERG